MPQANDNWFQNTAARDIHLEQLKQAERFGAKRLRASDGQ